MCSGLLPSQFDHKTSTAANQFEPSSPHGEVLLEFEESVIAREGTAYKARACGGKAGDGTPRWHGWVEFLPVRGGLPIHTARETTQPNKLCAEYWATGLTRVYLEGALRRARDS